MFKYCDCTDDARNRASRHNPCMKPAVVIVKSIYLDEESDRRDVEEDEYLMRFEEVEEVRLDLPILECRFVELY